MEYSLPLGTYVGIPIKVHWTFFLLMLWIPYQGYNSGLDGISIFIYFLAIISVFVCVILHEYGHAIAARCYGIETLDIIISPIGGIARLTDLPEKPMQEFVVTIAGPLVNILIATCIALSLWLSGMNLLPKTNNVVILFSNFSNLPQILLFFNIFMVLFNMLPSFPMDGGRIFRSFLSLFITSRLKATYIASVIGQIIASIFIIYGFYSGDFILPFIGMFLIYSGRSEYNGLKFENRLKYTLVGEIVLKNHQHLYLNTKMRDAQKLSTLYHQQHFIVKNDCESIDGILHDLYLKDAIESDDLDSYVSKYMSTKYEIIDASMNIQEVIDVMIENNYTILPVFEKNNWIGVIDRERIKEWAKEKKS